MRQAYALLALYAAMAVAASAQSIFTTLVNFAGANGWDPQSAPIQGTNGSLYGTTYTGGAYTYGGVIYELTRGGKLKILYSFCAAPNCADGSTPIAALVQATNQSFYGTTLFGGANRSYGTVFEMTPGGTVTTLYSFCSQPLCTDGEAPEGALAFASDGNLYGTTTGGGAYDQGTIFRITTAGTLTTLYSFCPNGGSCVDGFGPVAPLIQAGDGNLYGTTSLGGINSGSGKGTIFKITLGGTFTTLHTFVGSDGAFPNGIVQAADGNFYGTTGGGGANNYGTLFQMTPSGTLTTIYNFCSEANCADGGSPFAGPTLAAGGGPDEIPLYGTTDAGGAFGYGTIFQSTYNGTTKTLTFGPVDSFCDKRHCSQVATGPALKGPNGLVQDTSGLFYGTNALGGTHGDGTIFSLSVGLGAFVQPQPAVGSTGQEVDILGTNLTGATSVTFNGVAATFKVSSRSLIVAKVPAGATAGSIQVVTPGGTLVSNVPFSVLP